VDDPPGRERGDHRPGQVADVAGTDEDAVEHEDRRSQRLEHGDEPEHLLGEVAH
jgi:hypothetical protein